MSPETFKIMKIWYLIMVCVITISIWRIVYITNLTAITKLQSQTYISQTSQIDKFHYSFQYGNWLNDNTTFKTLIKEANFAFGPEAKRSCSDSVECKYFVGMYDGNEYYFNNSNGQNIICNLLISIISNNIRSIGDSVSIPSFYGLIRDLFQYTFYECNQTNITNISISEYDKIFYEITGTIHENNKYGKYHKMKDNEHTFEYCNYFDKHCVTKSKRNNSVLKSRKCQCVPRYDAIISFNVNNKMHSFLLSHIRTYSIFPDLTKYNTINQINKRQPERFSMGYALFQDLITEFDSTIINIGLHYDSMTIYYQTLRFIFDTLEQDIHNHKYKKKKHIFRYTLTQHFTDRNRNPTKQFGDYQFAVDRKCLPFNIIPQKPITHVLANEMIQHYKYIYTIDYYNVLKHRGDAHLGSDCTHWCASNKLWKPLWFLLTEIYNH
eukprot:479401_1